MTAAVFVTVAPNAPTNIVAELIAGIMRSGGNAKKKRRDKKVVKYDYIKQGDCLELMKDIPDGSVDLIVTDPPYGMNFKSNFRKESYEKIKNDNSVDFLHNCFPEFHRVLKDNTAVYCFCSWHNIDKFKVEFEKVFKLKNMIIWEKNNTSMGDLKGSYAPKYEIILYGHKGRRELEGYRYPDVLKANRTGNKFHPTQKPVDLIEVLISNSSKEGDVVLDPFLGSGTTAVACVNTKRHYIGFELDEKYFEIAKKRIEEGDKEGKANDKFR